MKFNINKNDKSKINKLIETKEINILISKLFLDFIDEQNFNKEIPNNSSLNIVESVINKFLEIEDIALETKEDEELFNTYIKPCFKLLSADNYLNNPYYKNINISKISEKNLSLEYLDYSLFEVFPYDDIKTQENNFYQEVSSLGFFETTYKYLALIQNNKIWMSINPNEINTMQPIIDKVSGNVLVFGLGLGYFQYMISRKKEVNNVLVIEKDKNIISYFKKYILPQFDNQNKIEIIEDDALTYINKINEKFNYVFIDLWHNPNDGIDLYLKFKKKEEKYSKQTFFYWLENGILSLLRRMIITLIEEELNGSTDNDYKKADNINDNIINKLHFLLKDYEINTYLDIKKLLSNESLKSLSSRIY